MAILTAVVRKLGLLEIQSTMDLLKELGAFLLSAMSGVAGNYITTLIEYSRNYR